MWQGVRDVRGIECAMHLCAPVATQIQQAGGWLHLPGWWHGLPERNTLSNSPLSAAQLICREIVEARLLCTPDKSENAQAESED